LAKVYESGGREGNNMTEYVSVKQMAKLLNISLDTAYVLHTYKGLSCGSFGENDSYPVEDFEKRLDKRKCV
jgi:hypothetical protein